MDDINMPDCPICDDTSGIDAAIAQFRLRLAQAVQAGDEMTNAITLWCFVMDSGVFNELYAESDNEEVNAELQKHAPFLFTDDIDDAYEEIESIVRRMCGRGVKVEFV